MKKSVVIPLQFRLDLMEVLNNSKVHFQNPEILIYLLNQEEMGYDIYFKLIEKIGELPYEDTKPFMDKLDTYGINWN